MYMFKKAKDFYSDESFRRIAVTDRHLCRRPFLAQIESILPEIDMLILREKDMDEREYEALAAEVLALCEKHGKLFVPHSFVGAARRLGCRTVHLPLRALEQESERSSGFERDFDLIGVSVHTTAEALRAQELGASYLTAGHIFATDCKAGLAPRGLSFLKEVCEAVSIPVYAIGGINDETEQLLDGSGAAGACRMSYYMKN